MRVVVISRNLLVLRQHKDTGFLKKLAACFEVLVVSPSDEKTIDGCRNLQIKESDYRLSGRLARLINSIRLHATMQPSTTIEMMKARQISRLSFLKGVLFRSLVWCFEKLSAFRHLCFAIERDAGQSVISKSKVFIELEEFKPDFIVCSAYFGFLFDELVIDWARDSNLPVYCITASWDNPTSYGWPRVLPNKALVWSHSMKSDTIFYNGINPKNVVTAGSLQWEAFANSEQEKPDFLVGCERFSTYFTKSPKRFTEMVSVVAFLSDLVTKDDPDHVLVVKLHPLFLRPNSETKKKKLALDDLENVAKASQGKIRLHKPRLSKNTFDFKNSKSETAELKFLLQNSINLFNHFSTINLDAAYFGKVATNVHVGSANFAEVGFRLHETVMDNEQVHNSRIVQNKMVKNIQLEWRDGNLTKRDEWAEVSTGKLMLHEELTPKEIQSPSDFIVSLIKHWNS